MERDGIQFDARKAEVTFPWPDEDRCFSLKIREIRLLEAKCDAGINVIWDRVASGRWKLDDIRETIRLALIGGGASDPKFGEAQANQMIKDHFDGRPLHQFTLLAHLILSAVLVGVEDEPLGQGAGANADAGKQQPETGSSTSEGSTASALN